MAGADREPFRGSGTIGAELVAWFGICAPAGLSEPIAERLLRELHDVTGTVVCAQFLAGIGGGIRAE